LKRVSDVLSAIRRRLTEVRAGRAGTGRRVAVVILTGLLLGATFLGVAETKETEYSATATLLLRNPTAAEALFGTGAPATAQNIERELATNEELVELRSVALRTAERFGGRSTSQIEEMVDITKGSEADLVSVEATADDPADARGIANTYARQYIAFRTVLNQAKLSEARKIVERKLDELPKAQQKSEEGKQLHTTAAKLAALGTMQTGGAAVIEPATLPESASSPKPVRDAMIGVLIGLLLGLAGVLFFARLRTLDDTDGRRRESADLT
jgi:uncharacterized protein involved in exopolysaccharide biosynthesis